MAGVFILPIDVPVAGPEVWRALKAALVPGVSACVPEWQGRGGHPVLLEKNFFREFGNAPDTSRLDVQLQGLARERVKRVAVQDANVVMNFNTPEHWLTYLKMQIV